MMFNLPRAMYVSGDVVNQRMQRTQIYLEPDVSAALDRLARQRRTSRAGLIREATREFLAREVVTEEESILGLSQRVQSFQHRWFVFDEWQGWSGNWSRPITYEEKHILCSTGGLAFARRRSF
jgi:hypothetical protein